MSRQRACVGFRPAVQPLAGQLGGQVQRRRAGGQADRVLYPDDFRDGFLRLVDIPAHGADPVGGDGVVHPALFIPVHGRRRKPYPVREWFDASEPGIRSHVHILTAPL